MLTESLFEWLNPFTCTLWNPDKRYCLVSKAIFANGAHYLNVMPGIDSNFGRISCCVGIISSVQREWMIHGIDEDWPSIESIDDREDVVSVHFDGNNESPYWNCNEMIGVLLDIDNLNVSFRKSSNILKSQSSLIKKVDIKPNMSYTFMMVAVPRILNRMNCLYCTP